MSQPVYSTIAAPGGPAAGGPTSATERTIIRDVGVAAAATFGVYLTWTVLFGSFQPLTEAYFPDLAAAFLQGRLDLLAPDSTHDLVHVDGRWYVPFPPLAALLMTPLVAAFGAAGVSTVLFCIVFGALNVALVMLILFGLSHRGWIPADRVRIAWLTALFGVGSVHWSMAVTGSVWFVGQVCAFTFAAAALAAAIWLPPRRAAVLAGAALGLAALGRPDLVLMWPLLVGVAIARHAGAPGALVRDPAARRRLITWAALSLAPLAVVGLLLALYNAARFGDPLEFGYLAENVAPRLADRLRTHGQFNISYLPQNLWAMLLAGPTWDDTLFGVRPDPRGMSLLLTTPALIYLGRATGGGALVRGAWLALALLLLPLLLYYNTGWAQFGYRFSLEFMLPVLVLLAHAVHRGTTGFRTLVLVGVLVNALGAAWWL